MTIKWNKQPSQEQLQRHREMSQTREVPKTPLSNDDEVLREVEQRLGIGGQRAQPGAMQRAVQSAQQEQQGQQGMAPDQTQQQPQQAQHPSQQGQRQRRPQSQQQVPGADRKPYVSKAFQIARAESLQDLAQSQAYNNMILDPETSTQEALSPSGQRRQRRMEQQKKAEVEQDSRGLLAMLGAYDPEDDTYFGVLNEADLHMAGSSIGGMSGGIAGASAGAAVGGPVGAVVGGVLGGAYGAFTGRYASGVATGEGPTEALSEGGEEAYQDALWSMGLPMVGRGMRMTLGKAVGFDTEKVREVLKQGEQQNVDIPPQSVVEGKMAQKYQDVVGVMPWIGTPTKKAAEAAEKESIENIESYLNTVAPNASLHGMGVDIVEAAKNTSNSWKRLASDQYNEFYRLSNELGDPPIVPTRGILDKIKKFNRGKRFSDFGRDTETDRALEVLRQQIEDNGVTHITPEESRQIQATLNDVMYRGKTEGRDVSQLGEVKRALDEAMVSMEHPARYLGAINNTNSDSRYIQIQDEVIRGQQRSAMPARSRTASQGESTPDVQVANRRPQAAQQASQQASQMEQMGLNKNGLLGIGNSIEEEETMIKTMWNSLNAANQLYATAADVRQNKAAQIIAGSGPQDPDLFQDMFNRNPNIQHDKIAETLLNRRSPDTIRELRNLVGSEVNSKLGYAWIEEAIEDSKITSQGDQSFDYRTIRKKLGLNSRRGTEAFRELAKDMGMKTVDASGKTEFEQAIEVGERYGNLSLRNTSDFLARRITLGGVSSIAAAANIVNPSHLFVTIPSLILARQGSHFFAGTKSLPGRAVRGAAGFAFGGKEGAKKGFSKRATSMEDFVKAMDAKQDWVVRREAAGRIVNQFFNDTTPAALSETFGVSEEQAQSFLESDKNPDEIIFGPKKNKPNTMLEDRILERRAQREEESDQETALNLPETAPQTRASQMPTAKQQIRQARRSASGNRRSSERQTLPKRNQRSR